MTKPTPLQKIEALAQQLIEGTFQRYFGEGLSLADICRRLAKVVEDEAQAGRVHARYNIRLNPADFERIRRDEPDVAAQITNYLRSLLQQAGLTANGRPHITLLADPAISQFALQISCQGEFKTAGPQTTKILPPSGNDDVQADEIAAVDAYLIVEGSRHVPLTKPLTQLGRSTENDIVLDSPTVSRRHAQIRWRYGRFILYDLSNRGRTQVNNQTVTESVLQSGDVISLSSTKLIYGEGETQQRPRPRPASQQTDETQIRPPTK